MSKVDVDIETVIVGGSFSCVPVITELSRTGNKFVIISDLDEDGDIRCVWKNLSKHNCIDFDLVSSVLTSYYSYDLLNSHDTNVRDRYPTANEFYEMIQKYHKKHKKWIIDGKVIKIENKINNNNNAYSIVYYKKKEDKDTKIISKIICKHLVLGLGFERKIMNKLLNFNYNICNKTIIFTTIGDTINLMISKLIARKNKLLNKIYIITNGFIA